MKDITPATLLLSIILSPYSPKSITSFSHFPLSLLPSLFSPSFFSLSFAFLVPLSSSFPHLPGPPTIHPPLLPTTSLAYAYHVFFEYNRGHFSQDRRGCLNQVEAGCLGRNPYLSLLNYQIQLHQILDKKKTEIGGENRK